MCTLNFKSQSLDYHVHQDIIGNIAMVIPTERHFKVGTCPGRALHEYLVDRCAGQGEQNAQYLYIIKVI